MAKKDVPRVARSGVEVDHYRLIEPLGSGFSSTVWKAQVVKAPPGVNLKRGQFVALKLYNGESGHALLRMERETAIAHAIRHPNVVRVHDTLWSSTRPLHPFTVMEYIAGETLRDLIDTGLCVRGALYYGIKILRGLAAIHAQGAIHRDVKPSNVMVVTGDDGVCHEDHDEEVKLLDLGIVQIANPDLTLTASGGPLLGSKHYASPEQLRGRQLTEKSDLYSFGATMIHCLTGRRMYDSCVTPADVGMQMIETPETYKAARPWTEPVAQFMNECVSYDSAKRPASAEVALHRLTALVAQVDIEERKHKKHVASAATPAPPPPPPTPVLVQPVVSAAWRAIQAALPNVLGMTATLLERGQPRVRVEQGEIVIYVNAMSDLLFVHLSHPTTVETLARLLAERLGVVPRVRFRRVAQPASADASPVQLDRSVYADPIVRAAQRELGSAPIQSG